MVGRSRSWTVRGPLATTLVTFLSLSILLAVAAGPAAAHGTLAGGTSHDNPTTAQLMLTPIVVGIIHVVAMVALLIAAYRARASGSVPDPSEGPVPEEAQAVFEQFLKEEDTLTHAFRPNRRMYIISKNLPHFFVLTGLATFFSIYTYKWLGDNTVFVYTTVHASAIIVLFAHSAVGWKNSWFGVSSKALYSSFGTFSPLAVSMPLRDLDSITVRESRLKGLLDVSSLLVVFITGKHRVKVDIKMRAIDSPDKIREVIIDEASRSKNGAD